MELQAEIIYTKGEPKTNGIYNYQSINSYVNGNVHAEVLLNDPLGGSFSKYCNILKIRERFVENLLEIEYSALLLTNTGYNHKGDQFVGH